MIKKMIKGIAILIAVVICLLLGYIIYAYIDYDRLPDNVVPDINQKISSEKVMETGRSYTAVTYNMGFGAYSPDYSFFMDGGKYSWALSKEDVYRNVSGAATQVAKAKPDFFLAQEVDLKSTRSYHVNEKKIIDEKFAQYDSYFTQNYDSVFIMYPFIRPHGKSLSGMMTYSSYPFESAIRRSLPIAQDIKKFLDLDRCYTISWIPVENGKKLILVNLHLSAYGNDDSIRKGQVAMLCKDLEREYKKGNYIVCGGDFNHDLQNTNEKDSSPVGWAYPFPRSQMPEGISFAMDRMTSEEIKSLHHSSRNADMPYSKDNYTVMLDGFIISDNVKLESYVCEDTGYAYSDHEPVVMKFSLK